MLKSLNKIASLCRWSTIRSSISIEINILSPACCNHSSSLSSCLVQRCSGEFSSVLSCSIFCLSPAAWKLRERNPLQEQEAWNYWLLLFLDFSCTCMIRIGRPRGAKCSAALQKTMPGVFALARSSSMTRLSTTKTIRSLSWTARPVMPSKNLKQYIIYHNIQITDDYSIYWLINAPAPSCRFYMILPCDKNCPENTLNGETFAFAIAARSEQQNF